MEKISLLQAIILGIVQGATEFLPISSTGHLVIAQNLLDVKLNGSPLLAFDIALHFGTLLALLVLFWRDLVGLGKGVLGQAAAGAPPPDESRRMVWYLILGTIPAVIIGLGFKGAFETMMTDMFSTGIQFVITGVILWLTRYVRTDLRPPNAMTWLHAVIIGIAQAVAIIPAISRSGTTIAAALLLRFDRDFAARFSFLLAIPALAGATVLSLGDLRFFSADNLVATLVGTAVSFVVGIACIKWLIRIIRRGRFSWFAIYCWVLGAIAMAASF